MRNNPELDAVLERRYLNDSVFHALCETITAGVQTRKFTLLDVSYAVQIAEKLVKIRKEDGR